MRLKSLKYQSNSSEGDNNETITVELQNCDFKLKIFFPTKDMDIQVLLYFLYEEEIYRIFTCNLIFVQIMNELLSSRRLESFTLLYHIVSSDLEK